MLNTSGFELVVVDAIDKSAATFYARNGFARLTAEGSRWFLTTKDLLASAGDDFST